MNRRKFIRAAGTTGLCLSSRLSGGATDQALAAPLNVLEDSPRERIPGELAALINRGLRYDELLAALTLAAVRNVQPYPMVGYKYHASMMLRAIHSATQHLPASDRWLPIAWAADHFKECQSQEQEVGGWRMPARSTGRFGSAPAAREALILALDRWDRDAADAAIVAYGRFAPPEQLFSLLFRYGARDLRAIGHKAIAVSNAHTLMDVLGRTQAEPLLRSTVAALQNSDPDPNPAGRDLPADQAWHRNLQRLQEIPPNWKQGRDDAGARAELRAALYRESEADTGSVVVALLQRRLSPEAIWRVLFETAAELLLREPGIVPLHATTAANSLYYAYRNCPDADIQQLSLLQCAAFIAKFRQLVGALPRDVELASLQPLPLEGAAAGAIDEMFSELAAGRRLPAARKSLGYLQAGGDVQALAAKVRHLVVLGADEPHDYKFPEALFDNCAILDDPDWRCRYLSAGMAFFKAPAKRPGPIVEEMSERLKT